MNSRLACHTTDCFWNHFWELVPQFFGSWPLLMTLPLVPDFKIICCSYKLLSIILMTNLKVMFESIKNSHQAIKYETGCSILVTGVDYWKHNSNMSLIVTSYQCFYQWNKLLYYISDLRSRILGNWCCQWVIYEAITTSC